ncbi:MAG: DegV family protein [Eubacteriaceae bacterium]|nr:DegV family protein [Eubacteriaceae bacterium]
MFKIITDNGADLPKDYLSKNDIGCMYLSTILDEEIIAGEGKDLSAEEFYRMLREGAKPTTSQINPENAREYFEKHIDEADEFLYIGLSSGLSGTVESVIVGAAEVMEKHPDKTIEIVDSLTGSPGEGLLVTYAVKMRNEGKSLSETASWLRANAKHVLLCLTVDDLFDLWRGGRVSRSSAVIGSMVSIKPFIIVDNEGHLQVVKKIRGRKKSLDHIVEYMDEHMGSFRDANRTMVIVNHGNASEDAEYTAKAIREHFGFENIMMGNVGPMIGTHTGASIVVAAFLGEERS